MPRPSLCLLLAGALALCGGSAWAQPKLTLVVSAHEPELLPKSLAVFKAVEEQVRKDARYRYVDIARLDPAATQARAAKTDAGKALLQEARAAFAQGQAGAALTQAKEAGAALAEGQLEEGFGPLLDALALEALLTHRGGNQEEAYERLARLFTLSPGFKVVLPRSTPSFFAMVEDVRGSVAYAPFTTLEVKSGKVPAWVYVDGAYRGVTPLRLEDVPPGAHYVTVLAPGYRGAQGVAQAGPEQSFTATLEPTPEGKELRRLLDAVTAAYPEPMLVAAGTDVAKQAGADVALLANLVARDNKLEVVAVGVSADGKGVASAKEVLLTTEEPATIARAILRVLEQPLATGTAQAARSTPTVTPESRPAPAAAVTDTAPRSGNRRTLAYAALGTSAAALAGGAFLGWSAFSQVNQAERIPQAEDVAYENAYSSSQRSALLANGLYAVSAVAAGVGVWLLVTGQPPRAAPAEPVSLGFVPVREGGQVLVGGSF